MQSHGKDLKAELLASACLAGTLTAASTGDNTLITGETIDISALSARPTSVVFSVLGRAVLTATKTLAVAALVEESVDGSTWTTAVASSTVLTLTGESGGSTELGVAMIGYDLIREDTNYVRLKVTPDLNASGTDTAIVAGVAHFGGLDRI